MHRFYSVLVVSLLALKLMACSNAPLESRLSPSAGGEEAATAPPPAEAGGEGGEGEHKKKPDEKPRPDSVVSSVMALPVVRQWSDYMDAKNNGNKLVAWGEYIKEVQGTQCWSIVVAEETEAGADTIWKRFCMQKTGLEMWVETSLGAKSEYEMNYISYDKWVSICKPTFNSPGTC